MSHITISDSNRGSRISLNVREQMTVCPPPNTTPEGDVLPYPKSYVQRYADLRAMKQAHPIYIEEDLDDSEEYHTTTKFRMLIRCLSSDADLQVIMAAAKHLDLVSQYTIKRGENDQLDPSLEISYLEILYTIGNHTVCIGDELEHIVYFSLSKDERARMWVGLFEAAGYRVKWGNALNIKRR